MCVREVVLQVDGAQRCRARLVVPLEAEIGHRQAVVCMGIVAFSLDGTQECELRLPPAV